MSSSFFHSTFQLPKFCWFLFFTAVSNLFFCSYWLMALFLFLFLFLFFLYLCWRCHLRSSHCTRKRFRSLPAHVRVSEAHIHVDYMGHQRTTPVWQAGGLCTDFLWKLSFAPLYLECPLSLVRYGSRRMKWQRVEFCRRVRGGDLSLQMTGEKLH